MASLAAACGSGEPSSEVTTADPTGSAASSAVTVDPVTVAPITVAPTMLAPIVEPSASATVGPSSTESATSAPPSVPPDVSASPADTSGADSDHTSLATESEVSSSDPDVASSAATSADTSTPTSEGASTHVTSDGCPHQGSVTYRFNAVDSWPADVQQRLTTAMDEATFYYNCYSELTKSLTINYNPGVPTAEGNVDGVISFGSNPSYMVTATAMHEIGHTLGVGYAPWSELIQDGRWTGPAVNELMSTLPAEQRDADAYSQRTYITCDNQHFWPYGLNQASEHQSEWSLINHVRVVAAMNEDKASVRGN